MSDLAAFLAARVAEDEAAARQSADSTRDLRFVDADADSEQLIWRFDPDRVLREVGAKRKILAEHNPVEDGAGLVLCGAETAWDDPASMATDWPCATVRALAAIYSDHSDYDPEWSKA